MSKVSVNVAGKEIAGKVIGKWALIILLGVTLGWGVYAKYQEIPSQKTLAYYVFKSNQYQVTLHQLIVGLQKTDPKSYNQIADHLNKVNKTAAGLGTPVAGDNGARVLYEVDSTYLEIPPFGVDPNKDVTTPTPEVEQEQEQDQG